MVTEIDTRWVPIALSADILDGTVIPAKLSTGPIAVWRSASGHLYANGDRCPHRGMRLSHGFVRGETLSCIYHGWRFGTDGACQKIPAHPSVTPPKTLNCGPLPVTEVNGVVWGARVSPAASPAQFSGYRALRSLVIAAGQETIIFVGDGASAGEAVEMRLGGHPALLLLNAYDVDETLVIALVEDTLSVAERLAVSGGLEALRREAEAMGVAA